MSNRQENTTRAFLEQYILPCFALPDGDIDWQGNSELDIESFLYYFRINDDNYLLVNEPYHGTGDHKLASLVTENAILPHQKAIALHPKNSTLTYVHISNKHHSFVPHQTGDFSLFHIIND